MPGRCVVPLIAAMVFLSSLPDAMVAPLLRDLLIDRYGVSESAAHGFMIVNMLGGVAAVLWLRRRTAQVRPRRLIACAAAVNGALLLVMALPIGFAATIAVRMAEGAVDLIVFAGLFELLRQSTNSKRCASRLGLGGTMLMLGLAGGMAVSGPLAAAGDGAAFAVGGLACLVAAVLATRLPSVGRDAVESMAPCPHARSMHRHQSLLWPAMIMAGTDRALGALLAVSVPMYVASAGSIPRALVGPMIAVAMLLMSVGAWAGGAIADRVGALQSRAAAAVCYGAAFVVLPLCISSSIAFVAVMTVIGLSGAVLLPTMLTVAGGSGRGVSAMGACQSAGNIGFAASIGVAAVVLSLAPAGADRAAIYATVLQGAAVCYLVLNGVSMLAMTSAKSLAAPIRTRQVTRALR